MTFTDAVKTVLTERYADFQGRARRPEYWWFVLFSIVVNLILQALAAVSGVIVFLSLIVSLALLIPGIAVGVRRMHDIGRTGWWLLIAFIPVLGPLVLIYFFIQPTQPGPNDWGPEPKA